jgi:hypothetical protein
MAPRHLPHGVSGARDLGVSKGRAPRSSSA